MGAHRTETVPALGPIRRQGPPGQQSHRSGAWRPDHDPSHWLAILRQAKEPGAGVAEPLRIHTVGVLLP